jgi:beta-N-acetylhexosaminidase
MQRRRNISLFAALFLGISAFPAWGAHMAPVTIPVGAEPQKAPSAIQRDIDRMSLREKVGQLVMFAPGGLSLGATERQIMEQHHLGGLILFARNYRDRSQLSSLTHQIQRTARRSNRLSAGALISVDQEGGVVKRFPDMPPRYSAPQLGDINKESVAYDEGRATAWALKSSGVNFNLAPVADLDLPPNHVMRSRSFGANRFKVGRLARAFTKGLQSRRVAASAKHFPGLGGATLNSDDGPAYVRRTRRQLKREDALPFHRMIGARLRTVMVGHAMYTNFGGNRPASLSHLIATKRLRKEFDFEGVAISDDLGALGWRFDGAIARACPATIRAGVDVALLAGGAGLARECAGEIYRAVREDRISKARLDRSVRRVLELKVWMGIYSPRA